MMLDMKTMLITVLLAASSSLAAEKTPAFRAQEIDSKVEIGYGVAAADVNGDGKPDILLADKKQFVWYENPSWSKHVLAENLTEHDNVCIAARDIDGDGKCEIAVGAEWNPSDTVKSGAVFYLIPPADRTQKWEAVKLHAEPTVHRMKWVRRGDREDGKPRYDLVVVPLHGRGNKDGAGEGVKVLAYQVPKDPHNEWKTAVISEDLHLSHNFDLIPMKVDFTNLEFILMGGKEGIRLLPLFSTDRFSFKKTNLSDHPGKSGLKGVGEIRFGKIPAGKQHQPTGIVTIEPMHGNQLAVYRSKEPEPELLQDNDWQRTVLDSTLDDGHALACGDVLGVGTDQIVVGWRAMAHPEAKVGIKMFVPDEKAEKWTQHLIDDNTMACEDLILADLDGDKRLDIIASGRRTKNLKVYWNETR